MWMDIEGFGYSSHVVTSSISSQYTRSTILLDETSQTSDNIHRSIVVVGVFNLLLGIYDYNLGKKWENEPKDIIKATKPLAVPIIVLVYNILIGGIIGIAGSIYYLIAIRNFVIENESYFAQFDSKE